MPKTPVIRTLLLWSGSLPVLLLLLLTIAPDRYTPIGFALVSIQILLFLLSITLVRKETVAKNKPIFVNFAVFFALAFVFFAEMLAVDRLNALTNSYFEFFYGQYISFSAYYFLLSFAVVYVAIDALFRDFLTLRKYAITLAIVGGIFMLYYSPFLTDPLYAHKTPEILDFKAVSAVVEKSPQTLTAENVAAQVRLHDWDGDTPGEPLSSEENLVRVQQLLPYTEGANFNFLVFGRLSRNAIYMSVLCIAFVILFFGYQILKDPPQGAYIEKIMFLFLVFSSLEAMHAWSYIKSLDWTFAAELWGLGNYMTVAVLFPMALYFGTRLHFITSVKGEYYEQEVAARPTGITRWRDALDDLIIDRFFNRKAIVGRMLVDPNRK
jgi:hypothetical protein